jgi:peptidoglycan-N-acetylglucosamine deacetylase
VLRQWAENPLITPGNHTQHHPNCAEIDDAATFYREVLDCEMLIKTAWPELDHSPKYFRFPFNAAGRDTLQHREWKALLTQLGYVSTPFTIESSDYVFNALYVDALKREHAQEAEAVVRQYLAHTLAVFRLYEQFCQAQYGRPIPHIYLCHGNQLHADHYDALIAALKEEGYAFVRLGEALQDEVYQQEDHYYDRWGISWLYRWMADPEIRKAALRKSPDPSPEILEAYQKL